MADTVVVNSKSLHRPLLTTELPSGANPVSSPIINYENWASAHIIDASKWDIARQCGSIENAPTYNELELLHTVFNSLGWPSSPSFPLFVPLNNVGWTKVPEHRIVVSR